MAIIIRRFLALAKSVSKESPTFRSLRVLPGRSALVESDRRASTPFTSQLAEPGQVDNLALYRGVVDFKVAGLNDDAGRGVDGHGAGVGDGVVDVDKFHRHASELHHVSRRHHVEPGGAEKTVLLEHAFHQSQGQAGAVDRNIHQLQKIDGADVVLMAMSQHQTLNFVPNPLQVGEIRNDQIHSQHFVVGEGETAVHQKHVSVAVVQVIFLPISLSPPRG